MDDKKFYGMALQLEWRYDRLVHQKNKIKKEVLWGLLTYLDALHRDPIIAKRSLDILCFRLVARIDGTM